MVDKNEEILRIVREKKIWRILLPAPVLDYKEKKKEYFSDLLQKGLGFPKDSEIAKAVLDQLFRVGFFKSKDHLNVILQTPFFSKNIVKELHKNYLDKLNDPELTKSKGELDLGLIEKQDYKIRIEEPREELKETIQEIDQKIKDIAPQIEDKRNEAEATPGSNKSLLDQQVDIQELVQLEEIGDTQRKYEPWWKTLGLSSDPFPAEHGLVNIEDSLYDRIIVFTDLYEKYVDYINNFPTELFKNIVLYGEYGSGKTTLFEYLRILLFRKNIYPAIITLSAEPDYQSFLMKLKQKLRKELVNIFEILGGPDLTATLDSMTLDDSISHLFKLIEQNNKCNGFAIFIDDIYKPPGYDNTALKFLNHLQTLKDELTHEMNLGNVGFFISAPREWEMTLNRKQAFSGSISLEEHMPSPTVAQARTMFNQRLAAFAIGKAKPWQIGQDSANQVYRTLESRNAPITFRGFIKECVARFRSGNFDILGKIDLKEIESGTHDSEEFILIGKLIEQFRDRPDKMSSLIRMYLREAQSNHKQIVKETDMVSNPVSFTKLTKVCKASIKALSNAVASYSSMDATGNDFWDNYWQYPESLRSFTNVLDKQSQSYEPKSISLLSAYVYAFTDIVKLFSDQIEKDKILTIPFIGLKNEEIKEFDAARTSYSKGDLNSAVWRTSTLVESKLRDFIYSVFLLQYGERNSRLQRIPNKIRSDITERMNKDKQNQIPLNKNEYTYLNRNQYDDLIAGRDGIGYDNWEHSFSEIFTNSGWNVYRVRSYLKIFHSYHLNVSHNRPDSFMNFNHPEVHQFMLDSMKIMIIINESYSLFLERVKKAEIPGSTTTGYYFYLNGGTVQPVRVSQTNRERIIELFKESKITTIDFSCPSILEERFRINYQELFAILSDLMKEVKITKHGPLIDFRIK